VSPSSTITTNQTVNETMKTLDDLFMSQLADMYDAAQRITIALPKLAAAATNPQLKEIFTSHLTETKDQIEQLDAVFKAFDEDPSGEHCPAMAGLLEECEEITKEFAGTPAIDAALICAVQKVEHYEIASYGCLHAWAELLENEEAAELLQEILDQDLAANDQLSELAVGHANVEAQGEISHGERQKRRKAA